LASARELAPRWRVFAERLCVFTCGFKPLSTSTSTGFPGRPLVEHWDGSGWQSVAVPGVSSGALAGVAMAGGKIWMVGNTVGTTGTDVRQLIVTNC